MSPCNRSRRTTGKTMPGMNLPTDPCQLLALARQALFMRMSGQAVMAIETPELGRVEFQQSTVADLQRMVDTLAAECAAATGGTAGTPRRKPISIQAWP